MRVELLAVLITAGCGAIETEQAGKGVDGVATGHGEACDMAEAERRALADVESECRRRSGRACQTVNASDCRGGAVEGCPRRGVICEQQGIWSAPDDWVAPEVTGEGDVSGAGYGCSRDEATRLARDDASRQCRERTGDDCSTFGAASCRDAVVSECPRRAGTVVNGAHCRVPGHWVAEPEGEEEREDEEEGEQEDEDTPEPDADGDDVPDEVLPCRWDFCRPEDSVCDFQIACLRQNGMERRCEDLYEQESDACRGDDGEELDGGDCPVGYCQSTDGYCDYETSCTDDRGEYQECWTDAELESSACSGGGEGGGDPCEGYDWQLDCVPCDGDDDRDDGCCLDDVEGADCERDCEGIDWTVFCVQCDGRDDDADACCDGWDYEEWDCWE